MGSGPANILALFATFAQIIKAMRTFATQKTPCASNVGALFTQNVKLSEYCQ